MLTNDRLDEEGNAALALGLLGTSRRLIWIVPDPLRRAPDGEHVAVGAAAAWVRWVVVQAVVALLLALLWRARRLGPVVPEPLPVVVRAAETTEGRGPAVPAGPVPRDRAAADPARRARRLAGGCGPAGAGPRRSPSGPPSGRARSGRAREVLLGPAPADERALVRLADDSTPSRTPRLVAPGQTPTGTTEQTAIPTSP